MSGINVGRWLAGGLVAAIVIFVLEGALSSLYVDRVTQALAARNITMEMEASTLLWAVVISLLNGLVLIFLYAAARPRFGAGVKTAVIVAVAMALGGGVPTLIGYQMLGLYPSDLLLWWTVQFLAEYIVAAVAGAWVYREPATRPLAA